MKRRKPIFRGATTFTSLIISRDPEDDGTDDADDEDGRNVIISKVQCICALRHVLKPLELLQPWKTKFCGNYLHWIVDI